MNKIHKATLPLSIQKGTEEKMTLIGSPNHRFCAATSGGLGPSCNKTLTIRVNEGKNTVNKYQERLTQVSCFLLLNCEACSNAAREERQTDRSEDKKW
jgi:hypothetical protein